MAKFKLKKHWECLKRIRWSRLDLWIGVLIGKRCGCGKPYYRILFFNEC